jgi:hypothetical protein
VQKSWIRSGSRSKHDGTGRWRTTDSGFPIDPSSQMVDGTPLDGPSSLRKALLSRPEAVVGTMTQKLLMYGIGRETSIPICPSFARSCARRSQSL